MQPKHTEPLFIPAAAGLLQGCDPEGMKNQSAIKLSSVSTASEQGQTPGCVYVTERCIAPSEM